MARLLRMMMTALTALVLLQGCGKNEFTVEFSLPANVTHAYRVLYYASDPKKGWYTETVADVRDGKGSLKGITRNPTLVFIFRDSGSPAAVFYAERGDRIKITGKGNDPATWEITGNGITERLSGWSRSHAGHMRDAKTLNKDVAGYVREHTDDAVSALLLMIYYDRRVDDKEFLSLFSLLKGDAADREWADMTGRADFLEGNPENVKMPAQLVLTVPGGHDTVASKGKPMLAVFTKTTAQRHERALEGLREIAREWKDSSQRIIVEINIEPDSMARYRTLRSDSLAGVIRAWLPLGFSDPAARWLGMSSVPSARVSDSSGKVRYQGDDMEKAFSEFRKLKK